MVIGLLGTDFASSNRGCGALGYAAIELINRICKKRGETLVVYAFLYRLVSISEQWDSNVEMHYVVINQKSFSFWKETRKTFCECDFVWDFTGGDSFSDIYGMKRFCMNTSLKQLAIWSKTKFVVAPQTIGPFENKFAILWAKHILKKAEICFVRDSVSKEYVKQTFGIDACLTTDVAFALPYEKGFIKEEKKTYIGFNPSGLLWRKTKGFQVSKHISLDYKEYVKRVLEFLCDDNRYKVCLIPHVFLKNCMFDESDMAACNEIKELFPQVEILCDYETPMDAKQIISSMDVFIGARMHATIASFSTGVATIPVSYSRKFEGLYHDLEYPYLIGASYMTTEEAVEKTIEWIEHRDMLEEKINAAASIIEERQNAFLEAIEKSCDV